MNDEIKVSVYTLCYNHVKYIRKCLDGLLMQKTSFKYEVLVNDDCSTDGSTEVIKEYANKYPDVIKPIFHTENQYSKGIPITKTFILPKVQGKYIASCEGDDYWTDENKLQEQFNAMESHPDCQICVHRVQAIYEDGRKKEGLSYPSENQSFFKEGVLSSEDCAKWLIAKAVYIFQTSSYFIRTECFKKMYLTPSVFFSFKVGDVKVLRYCFNEGNVYFIDKYMSCYRACSVGSWSSRIMNSPKSYCKYLDTIMNMDRAFDDFSKGKFHEYIEDGIRIRKFRQNILLGRFKELFRPEYRNCLAELSKKKMITYRILSFFPNNIAPILLAKICYLYSLIRDKRS